MNGLDLLRWVLLLIGAAVLIGVYVAGRRSLGAHLRRRRAERAQPPQVEAEAGTESLTVPDPELAELGRSIVLDERTGSGFEPESEPEPVIKVERPRARTVTRESKPRSQPESTPPPKPKPAPKLVVVYVTAPAGLAFRGSDVFEAAREAGLEYGDMRIFHHHETVDGRVHSIFSLANMVEPGWFDQEQQEQLQTPGVALFLQLPAPMDGCKAFDAMIAAAQSLKHSLGGELRDASRSIMSHQTIAHLRDEISDYERQQRTHSAAR